MLQSWSSMWENLIESMPRRMPAVINSNYDQNDDESILRCANLISASNSSTEKIRHQIEIRTIG